MPLLKGSCGKEIQLTHHIMVDSGDGIGIPYEQNTRGVLQTSVSGDLGFKSQWLLCSQVVLLTVTLRT